MNYEQKYLKYKTKYLELKQALEGGAGGARVAKKAVIGPKKPVIAHKHGADETDHYYAYDEYDDEDDE